VTASGSRSSQVAIPRKMNLCLSTSVAMAPKVEALIEHRVREQMQAGVEEAEVAEQLADPEGQFQPSNFCAACRRASAPAARKAVYPRSSSSASIGFAPRPPQRELQAEPEQRQAAGGESGRDQRLLQ